LFGAHLYPKYVNNGYNSMDGKIRVPSLSCGYTEILQSGYTKEAFVIAIFVGS
jgi:hypothetical protein